jgi:hypothetical protein
LLAAQGQAMSGTSASNSTTTTTAPVASKINQ